MPRNEDNDRRTEQFRKLFIGGLASATTEESLKAFYEQWGELVDCVVMKDNKTKRSRGFGFVTYREPDMVDAAQAARPHEIDGKVVETKRAMPREDSNSEEAHMTVNKLFVGGLKKDITKEDLQEYFSKYGTISSVEIVTDKNTGASRGFGFITFTDYDPVDKAILYKPHIIKGSRSDIKKALSKEQINSIKIKQEVPSFDFRPGFYGHPMGGPRPPYPDQYGRSYGYQMGGFGPGYDQGGFNSGFGQYQGQSFSGGPMRTPAPTGGYRPPAPYSGVPGGFGRRN